jgi:protein disulfide-isomerase A1
MKDMRPLAQRYKEYLAFTTIDANEYGDMQPALGLRQGASKVLSVQQPSNGNVFPYTGKQAISAQVVEQFLGNIIEGNIRPWVPGQNDEAVKHEEL